MLPLGLFTLTGAVMQFHALEEKEKGLLERLQSLSPREVESRAKAKGEWQSGNSEHLAAAGDLVLFSLEDNSKAMRVGIIQDPNKEGYLQVLSGNASETETHMIKDHQIQGYISRPETKPTLIQWLTQPFGSQQFDYHKRLIHLMSGLLSDK